MSDQILNLQNANLGTVKIDSSTALNKRISGFMAIEDLTITAMTPSGAYADLSGVTIPAGIYIPGVYTAMTVSAGTALGVVKQ